MRPDNNLGFTLAEVMVVVSILGLLAVLSIPRFNRYHETMKLVSDSQKLASKLRLARSAAIMKNANAVFRFNPNANTYFYFEDNDADGVVDSSEYQSGTSEFAKGIRVTYSLSLPEVTFESKGNTAEGGTITLTNLHDRSKTVRISGGTGNIHVD